MKAIRTVCPRCGTETKVLQDENSLNDYSEEIVRKRCQECQKLPRTPEEKLLEAIFCVREEE